MKLMERVKKAKKNKKGFTLVELIVVIVILGILIAVLVPSFVKYVNDAKEAQVKVEARSAYVAANYLYAKSKYKEVPTQVDIEGQADLVANAATIEVEKIKAGDGSASADAALAVKYTKEGIVVVIPENSDAFTAAP